MKPRDIWTTWDWRATSEGPPSTWPRAKRRVVLVDDLHAEVGPDDGERLVDAYSALRNVVSRGAVAIFAESPSVLRFAADVATRWPRRMVPALRVERQDDLDGDGLRALCSINACYRALVVSPREHIEFGLLGTLPRAWGAGYRLLWEFVSVVVVRGPTGPNAWPMQPKWVRALRDEAAQADVPFAFLGWGDWLHIDAIDPALPAPSACPKVHTQDRGGRFAGFAFKVGALDAGRRIDGREHLELPEGL